MVWNSSSGHYHPWLPRAQSPFQFFISCWISWGKRNLILSFHERFLLQAVSLCTFTGGCSPLFGEDRDMGPLGQSWAVRDCHIIQRPLIPQPWSCRRELPFGSQNSTANLHRSLKKLLGLQTIEIKNNWLVSYKYTADLKQRGYPRLCQSDLNLVFWLPSSSLSVISWKWQGFPYRGSQPTHTTCCGQACEKGQFLSLKTLWWVNS